MLKNRGNPLFLRLFLLVIIRLLYNKKKLPASDPCRLCHGGWAARLPRGAGVTEKYALAEAHAPQ